MLTARIEGPKGKQKLVIEIDVEEPKASTSGKTMVIASSHGNQTTTATFNGKPIVIGLNAYFKP
jgi:hypothetical protein